MLVILPKEAEIKLICMGCEIPFFPLRTSEVFYIHRCNRCLVYFEIRSRASLPIGDKRVRENESDAEITEHFPIDLLRKKVHLLFIYLLFFVCVKL